MDRAPRLGTRGSPLALAQAREVAAAIEAAQGWPAGFVEVVPITTSGDRIKDRPLAEVGGKGLWTKELDSALLAGDIDFAVHSAKDVEVVRPETIRLAAVRPRTHVVDVLVGAPSIDALREGAVLGTSSPRRKAQLLAVRPDLTVVTLRGNVETRLRKLSEGEADATVLSSAGLHRLGLDEVGSPLPFEIMLPAPGQGAIAVECRAGDPEWAELLESINDRPSRHSVLAERAFARALGGSCHSPVAAMATAEGDEVRLTGEILSEDGLARIRDEAVFAAGDEAAAAELALAMLDRAPDSIRRLFAPA
ncbi:MAG: hydroxymethylbilane synthase [Alphaproteobacteria bacterium]